MPALETTSGPEDEAVPLYYGSTYEFVREHLRDVYKRRVDGAVVGSIANAFDEEHDGFTARLSVTLPATCAPDVVDQHLEHFAVEFRTWILRAAPELTMTRAQTKT